MKYSVWILALSACCAIFASAATDLDFDHYQVILDRQPFGSPPPPPPPNTAPQVPLTPQRVGPPWAEKVRLCGLSESGGQVRVAFIDNAAKPPKNYYLSVGDRQDAFAVIEVMYEYGAAQLERDGERYWMYMDGRYSEENPGGKDTTTHAIAATPVATKMPQPGRRIASAAASATTETAKPPHPGALRSFGQPSLSDQLRARRSSLSERRSDPPVAKLKQDELETHLRKYNLELIRAGGKKGPALPIELTPEEDAKLVKEGALPPPPPE